MNKLKTDREIVTKIENDNEKDIDQDIDKNINSDYSNDNTSVMEQNSIPTLCLDIKDLKKGYCINKREPISVLKGITIEVKKGEMVAIMGPSGSGKTTFLNVVSGIDSMDSGCIKIEGESLGEMTKSELAIFRRRKLGMVFQDFNLIESLSIKDNILLPMILDSKTDEEQEEQFIKIADILNIKEIQTKYITEISGGQKQRVAIARALMNKPKLLLADEPTGNLDIKSTREVMNYFTKINQAVDTTILLVTHDSFAASFCNRAVLLRDGDISHDIIRIGKRLEFLEEISNMLTSLGGEQYDNE